MVVTTSALKPDEVIHLCFHGIGEPSRELEAGEAVYWIENSFFMQVLDELGDRPGIEISFDDGNKSDVSIGLPALLERSMTASFFPIAGRVGQSGSVNSADLRELLTSGMRIGTHGMNHRPWPTLSASERTDEYYSARSVLAAIVDQPITAAAMPLGRYNRRVLLDLKKAGYQTVYSSDRLPARTGKWMQARYSLTASDDLSNLHQILAGPRLKDRVVGKAKVFVKSLR